MDADYSAVDTAGGDPVEELRKKILAGLPVVGLGSGAAAQPAPQPAQPSTPAVSLTNPAPNPAPKQTPDLTPPAIGATAPSTPAVPLTNPSAAQPAKPVWRQRASELQAPNPKDYQAGPPTTGRKLLAILAGAAGGALNPAFGARLGEKIWKGPQAEKDKEFTQAESQYGQEQKDITLQAGLDEKAAQTREANARAKSLENPQEKQGLTPEEQTVHDLMTGDNGKPRVNPQTGKPYSYLEAYGAVKQAAQDVKPPPKDKHSPGEVKLDEGIPTGIYGDADKLWRANDPAMPDNLKASLGDAVKAHGQKYKEDLAKQREGRAVLAGSHASTFVMPDGTLKTVTGDELPQFMKDNPQAVQTTPGATVQAMGRQALIGDIRRAANSVRTNLTVLDAGTFDRAKLAAALADPNSTAGAFLQSYPRAAEDDKTQQFISDLYSLREQAMAMRSVLGAGQGSEDLRRAILQTLPGVGSPSSKFGEKQINNLLAALDTLEKGVPKAPQRGGGTPPANRPPLSNFEGKQP
jgi:hypothetical protein